MDNLDAVAAERTEQSRTETVCLREVRAELVSLGGAILLAVCILFTVMLIIAMQLVSVSAAQQAVLFILTGAAWLYLLDSVTERLRLFNRRLEYTALLSRRLSISLEDLEAIVFVHEGFNLERGIESFEFRRHGGAQQDRLALGPCWRRRQLEAFLHAVEEALKHPKLIQEVR